jgi:hypothetical protein
METIGYILLAIVAVIWIVAMIYGMISSFPVGIIGLIAIVGIGLLLAKVIKDRVANKEDDHYSRNVDK